MTTEITPQAAADALGISMWDLALAQGRWATEELHALDLNVTSNRASTLNDFDLFVQRARMHWEGALETMRAMESEEE